MSARQEIIDVEPKTRKADFDKCGCDILAIGIFKSRCVFPRGCKGQVSSVSGSNDV